MWGGGYNDEMITVVQRDFFLVLSFFSCLMIIVHTVEMHCVMPVLLFCFVSLFFFLLHPLGKPEEERSFHSVTTQCASRK